MAVPVPRPPERLDLAAAADLLARGDVEGAIRAADDLLLARPSSLAALRLRLDAEQAAGRSRAALRTVREIRRRKDADGLAALERVLAATMLLEETDWVPDLAPRPPCHDPEGPSIVIVPPDRGRGPGRTEWVDGILGDLAEADLRPVAIPPPGAPSPLPADGAEPGDHAIRWHPLDLGPAYPADPPADRAVLDHAWAAAAAARTIRPSRVIALVAEGDAHAVAVGLALKAATGCPLAAIVGPGPRTGPETPGSARLRLVDRVVVTGAANDPGLVAALRALDELLPAPRVTA